MGDGRLTFDVFKRIFAMPTFTRAISNTLKIGFVVGIFSALIGLLFAYVEVYVKMNKFVGGLFKVVSMLPVVSPPFVLSLSMIMLFGKAGIITRFLLGIYDNSVYGYWGIVIVQTLTFFPVCYMMLKGLLKNIDPSLEEAARDMGASRLKVFTSVTLPLMLPGLGNAFLVTFIESIADFANPMIIGGSYDTLATTIYLQITGSYDKPGAAAMAVVLLCITLAMFAVQKYYLEAKTSATLTGKASRGRMLIEDKSVKVPLTVLCAVAASFVILMYICVPIGSFFPTWGYKFFPLTGKWFKLVFTRYHGFQAFRDSFVLLAHRRSHYGAAEHDNLLSRRQAQVQGQGLHRGRVHARHGRPRYGSRRRLHPRLRGRRVPHGFPAGALRHRTYPHHRVCRPLAADRHHEAASPPCGRLTSPSRNRLTTWVRTASACS